MRWLIACECSGVVRDALKARGHYAMSCDLQETEIPGEHYKGDVRDVLGEQWDGLIAHPVCKYLCNSGVKHLHTEPGRWAKMEQAAEFYNLFVNATHIPRRAIENPIMHGYGMDLVGGGATQFVQPWWFGEKAFKATGLRLIGLPKLVATNKLIPPKPGTAEHKEWSFIHRMAPGPNRERDRSRTFHGIGDAMASQWGNYMADRELFEEQGRAA